MNYELGLTKEQMQCLVDNIQYIFDNPIKKIDWIQIRDLFQKLLDKKIEYTEDEIRYLMEKLRFPESIQPQEFLVLADELRMNFVFTKNSQSKVSEFEKENPQLIACLNTILFDSCIASHLTYPTDYWNIMSQFEKILKDGINYDTDKIKNWLEFYQKETTRENDAIENIVKIAEFMQLYFTRPSGYSS